MPSPDPSDLDDLLSARFGDAAPALTDPALRGNPTLAVLLSHRSVRRFAPEPVGDEIVQALVAAAQSAASSSNNQVWSVVEVRDAPQRRRLVDEAGASAFAADAPVILLFVADWARASRIAAWREEGDVAVDYLESTLVGFVDAALAAQNAVIAAESLGLGTCYLGSLRNRPEVAAGIAGLPERAVVAFGVALGRPHPDDAAGIKPRLAPSVVHGRERYRPVEPADVEAYEERLARYNAGQGRVSPWARAIVARVRDIRGLHGREDMRAWLERRGLPSR
ncbi:nitroreductase family protein [Microbacterium aureliae]